MNIVLRPGRAADYLLFARLFRELEVPEPPPSEERFQSAMLPRVIIATDDGVEAGYAFYQVYGELGHVVNVVVSPGWRGRGMGRALMEEVRRALRQEGCVRWYLNVKQDNLPAIALYRRVGLLPEGELWPMRLPWSAVAALPQEDPAPPAHAPAPDEDGALAAWSGLPLARFGVLRQRLGVVLRSIDEGGGPCAFAAFDTQLPGIHPLRLSRPALLRPLLESLRSDAGEHSHLVLVVERDVHTRESIRAAGGELLFALLQMASDLTDPG